MDFCIGIYWGARRQFGRAILRNVPSAGETALREESVEGALRFDELGIDLQRPAKLANGIGRIASFSQRTPELIGDVASARCRFNRQVVLCKCVVVVTVNFEGSRETVMCVCRPGRNSQ